MEKKTKENKDTLMGEVSAPQRRKDIMRNLIFPRDAYGILRIPRIV